MNDTPYRIASGYTLDLYCKNNCITTFAAGPSDGSVRINTALASYFADGKNCYAEVRKQARAEGWILHKDNTATCPECNKRRKR